MKRSNVLGGPAAPASVIASAVDNGPGASGVRRLALALGLTLAAGFGFTPAGCGGSAGGFTPASPVHGDAEVPEGIALQLRTCAAAHRLHLGSVDRSVSFDVKLTSDGGVDSVRLKDSTLGDEDLEGCMASALRSLSQDDLPLHSSRGPRDPEAPESRALLGQEQALGCLASPPCLLAVGFLIGAAYIAVQIYVFATSHSGSKSKPRTATVADTADDAGDYEEICWPIYEECLKDDKQPAWNQKNYGTKKPCQSCYQECLLHSKPRGTWPDYKCPRN